MADVKPRAGRGAGHRPVDYVTAEFSPTAQRILAAARHILARDGYSGLTLQRIADEAGEHKSLVIYHFGTKATLVAVLVDSFWHDADVALVAELEQLPTTADVRIGALMDLHRRFATDADVFRLYFDLLPQICHDHRMQSRLADFYESYRRIGVMCLEVTDAKPADLLPLSTLLLAICEGLAVQVVVDSNAFDSEEVFALLEEMVRDYVGQPCSRVIPRPDAESTGPEPAPKESSTSEARIVRDSEDRVTSLPPVAKNILTAAGRVFRSRGLEAVTLEAVAVAADEPRSAISYYFGDKRGLLSRLHQSVVENRQSVLRRGLRRLPVGFEERAAAVVDLQKRLVTETASFRLFYGMLPAVLRDDDLLRRESAFLEWSRGALARHLAPTTEPESRDMQLAVLTLAASYGLAIQGLVCPKNFDFHPVFALWHSMVSRHLSLPD